MHAFVGVLLSFSLLSAPGSEVGVVWHDQATVADGARQRLLRAIAEEAGVLPEDIVDDAVRRARQVVAHGVPRAQAEQAESLDAALVDAATQYRTGALDAATATLDGIAAAVKTDPILPGAVGILWRAHVLRAQIAGTRGDDEGVSAALLAAIALDPEARPSTRRVPPAIVGRHAELLAEALADRAQWASIEVRVKGGAAAQVEIDGRPQLGPVMPGPHLVVVRRPGRAPIGREVEAGAELLVPDEPPEIEDTPPRNAQEAEKICEVTALGRLVLARERDGRLGLQAYVCGEGFGEPWFGNPGEAASGGLARVLTGPPEPETIARVFGDALWPAPVRAVDARSPTDGPVDRTPPPKAWYRRWWVWALVGGAVAAGVTTGAVLGTRSDSPSISVDADQFGLR